MLAQQLSASIVGRIQQPLTMVQEFNPSIVGRTITDPFLWIDMKDPAAFVESAGAMVSITNKASGVVASTALTVLPAYQATGFNGFPCMDFNGTTHGIGGTEAAILTGLSDATAYTLYYVFATDVADLSACVFGVGSSAEATNRSKRWGTFTTAAGVWIYSQNNNAGTNTNTESSEADNTNANIAAWRSGATNLIHSVNNVVQTMSSSGAHGTGALTPTRWAIGCLPRSTPAAPFNGRVAEVKAYAGEHGAGVASVIVRGLAEKWGITL